MNPRLIQISGQSAGAVLGVGALGLIAGCFFSSPFNPVGIGISLFFAAFFLWAGYLCWFRWSPLAIRHLVGDVFFIITVLTFSNYQNLPFGLGVPWLVLALPVYYALYRITAHVLTRRAFPTNTRPPPLPAASSPG